MVQKVVIQTHRSSRDLVYRLYGVSFSLFTIYRNVVTNRWCFDLPGWPDRTMLRFTDIFFGSVIGDIIGPLLTAYFVRDRRGLVADYVLQELTIFVVLLFWRVVALTITYE